MKKALITGITGQDGSYLAEFLLDKGYEVFGLTRRVILDTESQKFLRINHFFNKIKIYIGEVSDFNFIKKIISEIKPDEIYYLASSVEAQVSFDDNLEVFRINIDGVYNFLVSIRDYIPTSKFFFAGTSKMFGDQKKSPQNEDTLFSPISPYGIAKTSGFYLVKMFRQVYKIFACTGILYNHESPRRDFNFLPRKITSVAAKIKFGVEKELRLGNLEAERDWGFAGDYIEAMWLMLQTNKPEDYVVGTGEIHSVKDILDISFKEVGLNWKDYVVSSDDFFRKEGVTLMVADISKIKDKLKWQPKTTFKELIKMMVREDVKFVKEKLKIIS